MKDETPAAKYGVTDAQKLCDERFAVVTAQLKARTAVRLRHILPRVIGCWLHSYMPIDDHFFCHHLLLCVQSAALTGTDGRQRG